MESTLEVCFLLMRIFKLQCFSGILETCNRKQKVCFHLIGNFKKPLQGFREILETCNKPMKWFVSTMRPDLGSPICFFVITQRRRAQAAGITVAAMARLKIRECKGR